MEAEVIGAGELVQPQRTGLVAGLLSASIGVWSFVAFFAAQAMI